MTETKESKDKLQKKNVYFKYKKPGHYTKACCQRKLKTGLTIQKSRIKMLAAARQFVICEDLNDYLSESKYSFSSDQLAKPKFWERWIREEYRISKEKYMCRYKKNKELKPEETEEREKNCNQNKNKEQEEKSCSQNFPKYSEEKGQYKRPNI